jgi:hypothetical protein
LCSFAVTAQAIGFFATELTGALNGSLAYDSLPSGSPFPSQRTRAALAFPQVRNSAYYA